jgi:hypothetical protein
MKNGNENENENENGLREGPMSLTSTGFCGPPKIRHVLFTPNFVIFCDGSISDSTFDGLRYFASIRIRKVAKVLGA